MKPFKALIWGLYDFYDHVVPFPRGKHGVGRFLENNIGIPVRSVNGVLLSLSPISSADNWLIDEIAEDPVVNNCLDEFISPGSYFLDIGANIGFYSIVAAKQYGAQVIAFEPSKPTFKRLTENIEANTVNIDTRCVALGRESGCAPLYTEKNSEHLKSKIYIDETKETSGTEVELIDVARFDELISGDIAKKTSLVKIDVEGFEMEVLQGMTNLMSDLSNAAFVIEVSPKWLEQNGSSAQGLYDFMEQHGWVAKFGITNSLEQSERLEQWDEVFIRP